MLCEFASQRGGVTPSALALEQIDAPLGMDFFAALETARRHRPTTRNTRLAARKSCMHVVEYRVPALLEQIQRVVASPAQKTDQPLIQPLAVAEMEAILNGPERQRRSGFRERARLHVGFAAGLRGSARLTLPRTALTWQPTTTIHLQGKGRRHRALPRWQHTAEDVRAWLAVRGHVAVPELFVSAQGRAMTRVGFASLLRKYVHQAVRACPALQGQQVSPHVLRHPCAMLLDQATGDLRKVSRWFGPAEMHATAVDVRADPTETRDALAAVIPPSAAGSSRCRIA